MYIWDIPICCQKEIEENIEYNKCVRLVKNMNLTYIDFLPTVIEEPDRREKWNIHIKGNCGDFSVSLFESIDRASKFRGLMRSHPHIAIGKTNIDRGVATDSDKKGHINYFLFDYEDKSPCDDFEIFMGNGEENE